MNSVVLTFGQVEKQEKPKTPKGRAKKRLTYTRRFINVTLTGGKRKVRKARMQTPEIQCADWMRR
jgi:small subunit ribosomal protein S30e